MAIIKNTQIPVANIKTRWEEPYVSSAINRMLSAMPRGVYRGFDVTQMGAPGSGVRINIEVGQDSFLLHEDILNGYKSAVRYTDSFNIPFIFTPATDYYVWVDVDYMMSAVTDGYIRVGEVADLAAATNAIVLCGFNVAAGAIILDADISKDPTATPVTFMTPVPDTSEFNKWGMLDQARFDRLPTQNEKNAMTAANAPTTLNPFATLADAPTDIPFTYVISDGVRSTGGDYDGPTALVDVLAVVSAAGVPGDIYVRRGEYTLTATETVTVPVRIYCEGHNEQAVAKRCILAMSNAAGYGLDCEQPTKIYGLETTVTSGDGIQFQEDGLLVDCKIAGAIKYDGSQNGGAIRCIFDTTTTVAGCHKIGFDFCSWVLAAGGYCLSLSGTNTFFSVTDCVLDGVDLASGFPYQDGGGIGLAVAAVLVNATVDNVTAYCTATTSALYLNSTGSISVLSVKNIRVIVVDEITTDVVAFGQGNNSVLEVENLHITLNHSDPVAENIFSWIPNAALTDAVATFTNIYIRGLNNQITESVADASFGLVTILASGAPSGVTVRVNNMMITGFKPNAVAATRGQIVSVGVDDVDSTVIFDGLTIANLSASAIGIASYITAFEVASGGGKIILQNSTLDGTGLDDSFATNYIGVSIGAAVFVTKPAALWIVNSLVSNWYEHDVYIANGSELVIDGLRHEGSTKLINNTAGARIYLSGAVRFQIRNCFYDNNASGLAAPYWLYVATDTADNGIIMGNFVFMALDGDFAIYVVNGAGPYTFFGNSGVGTISVLGADVHLGVGVAVPPPHNTNDLTVALR